MAMDAPDPGLALDVQGLDKLRHRAAQDPESGLKQAAQQFEALFLQIMMKSMREAIPESDLMNSKQTRFYDEMLDKQWAQSFSEKGIGLADQLTQQLEKGL